MKKYIIIGLLIMSFILSPTLVSAQTSQQEQINILIRLLQSLVKLLQYQLSILQGQHQTSVTLPPVLTPPYTTNTSGFLEGSVALRFNNPCVGTTMPCDPIISITIYKTDGKTIAGTAQNWNTSGYRIELPSGEYILYTQNGPSNGDIQTHLVSIVSGKITKLDLTDPILNQ